MAWLEEHSNYVKWPLYSPDLNPIENLWFKLKEMIYEIDPAILNSLRGGDIVKGCTSVSLLAAWEAIPQKYFNDVIGLIKSQIEAVTEVKGWHMGFIFEFCA
jgi:transposase